MALPAFDTLRIANRLKAVGVPSAQAEAEAEVLSEVFEVNLKELATKEDLRATKEDLRRENGDLRKDMDAKFAGVDAKFAGVDAKFAGLEQRFDSKLDRAVSGLRQEMSDMKFVLIKWIVGLGLAQTGLWFTLKLFPIGS